MQREHIARAQVMPAAGADHQPRRVKVLDKVRDSRGIVLSPALVEGEPEDDAGMIAANGNDATELAFEFTGRLRHALNLFFRSRHRAMSTWQILPHEQAKF